MVDTTRATSWGIFRQDLAAAAKVWRFAPGVALLTAALLVTENALFAASESLIGLALPGLTLAVITVGFPGTQRIWYLRGFHGDEVARAEIWELTKAFFGRFFVLGLLTTLAGAPIIAVCMAANSSSDLTFGIVIVAWWFVMDLVLTFVTPALAYTTRSVQAAFRIGLGTLRETWPASKWYALVPGLALAAVGLARPSSTVGAVGCGAFSALAGMVTLWFKGAIAAFYLRRHPETGFYGAAYNDQLETS